MSARHAPKHMAGPVKRGPSPWVIVVIILVILVALGAGVWVFRSRLPFELPFDLPEAPKIDLPWGQSQKSSDEQQPQQAEPSAESDSTAGENASPAAPVTDGGEGGVVAEPVPSEQVAEVPEAAEPVDAVQPMDEAGTAPEEAPAVDEVTEGAPVTEAPHSSGAIETPRV